MTTKNVKIEPNLTSIGSMVSLMEETIAASDSYLDKIILSDDQSQQVPISADNFRTFQGVKADVIKLSKFCLFALKMEIRGQIYFYMDLIFREGNYEFTGNKPEPDHYVYILNHSLSMLEDICRENLHPNDFEFIFSDLQVLFENLFTSNLKYIKTIDDSGILKMRKNIISIEQHLRDIQDVSLLKAEHFYGAYRHFDDLGDYLLKESYKYKQDDLKYLLELKKKTLLSNKQMEEAQINAHITKAIDQVKSILY
eukprot:NODE_227_length_12294_cov_1.542681.p7 type:complete len:254 gc:universal NODE_227_length_12294_cov_1.542681:7538-6777(-)